MISTHILYKVRFSRAMYTKYTTCSDTQVYNTYSLNRQITSFSLYEQIRRKANPVIFKYAVSHFFHANIRQKDTEHNTASIRNLTQTYTAGSRTVNIIIIIIFLYILLYTSFSVNRRIRHKPNNQLLLPPPKIPMPSQAISVKVERPRQNKQQQPLLRLLRTTPALTSV